MAQNLKEAEATLLAYRDSRTTEQAASTLQLDEKDVELTVLKAELEESKAPFHKFQEEEPARLESFKV